MAIPAKEKLKTIFGLIKRPKVLSAILSLYHSGYLVDVGWFNSFIKKMPVDKDNNPIPWFTYSAIDFLSERLNKELEIFEYGSGNSTIYFAQKAKYVIAAEHEQLWFENLNKNLPENAKLLFCPSDNDKEYVGTIKKAGKKFDIIVIDGIFRNECCVEGINHLNEEGVIILDDSEREEYEDGILHLPERNFRKIDFTGMAPGYLGNKSTSIFYNSTNCLGI